MFAGWLIRALALLELLPSFQRQLQPADAFLTCGGTAFCLGLALLAVRGGRAWTPLTPAWLALGAIRAAAILWGSPLGWYVNQTASIGDQSASSATRMLDPLLFAASRLDSKPKTSQLLGIGVLLGLAVLARSTAWLAVPFVAWIICRDRRGIAYTLLPVLLLAALIPARNVLASGHPVLMPTSGPVNLYMGNVPSNVPPLILAPSAQMIQGQPWEDLARVHDPYLVAVAETAVTEPSVVLGRLLAKLGYVLGFARSMGELGNPSVVWFALAPWLAALVGIASRPRSRLALVALALALTNSLAVVVIYPSEYFYKLVLPGLFPLAVWGALSIKALADELKPRTWRLHWPHG